MKRTMLIGLVVAAPAVLMMTACSSSSSSSGSASSSSSQSATTSGSSDSGECGTHEVNGIQVRTFCGNGTITIKYPSGSYTVDKAECVTDEHGFTLNAGTIVLGSDSEDGVTQLKKTTQYAAVQTATAVDGNQKGGIVGNNQGTAITAAQGTVVLKNNMTSGTASAKETLGSGQVTADFTC